MPPKSPKSPKGKDKKGKDKKNKKKKKNEIVFSNVDKAFCHLNITDLNRKLAHLRSHLYNLEEANIALKKDNEVVTDRKDAADFLQRKLDKREEEFKILEKEFEHITQLRESENAEYQMKIKDLEAVNDAMKKQLMFEIKLMQGKLNCLEEYRHTRHILLSKLEDAEDAVEQKEAANKLALFEMEEKALIEKDNLKKGIEMKLLQLAEDFARSNEIRASSYTRRLIRENIALHKEIEQLITAHIKMKSQYDEYVFRNKGILQNYTALEDTNHNLLKKLQTQVQIIEVLTEKSEMFAMKYNEITRANNIYQRQLTQNECDRFNYKTVSEKLHNLRIRIDDLKLQNSRLTSKQLKYEVEISMLKETFNVLRNSIEVFVGIKKPPLDSCKTGTDQEVCEAEAFADNRQNLLMKLLEILNMAEQPEDKPICTPVDSREDLYKPGNLGFIPIQKPSLIDMFLEDVPDDTNEIHPMNGAMNMDNLRLPEACEVEGNSVSDMEMGSLFIASSLKSEIIVQVEEQEPLEYPEDNDSSSGKQSEDEIVCDQPAVEPEKEKPAEIIQDIKSVQKSEESDEDRDNESEKPSIDLTMQPIQDNDEEAGDEGDEEEEFEPFHFY